MEESGYKYDAFISYSNADEVFAQKLEKVLESYTPPKSLKLPNRRLNIFRYEGDMTGTEYFQAIEEYLRISAKLIVICSPSARKSEYVHDEIQRFSKLNSVQNIIPILLDGIPNNDATIAQEDDKAFPEILCQIMEMPLAINYTAFTKIKANIKKGDFEGAWFSILANIYSTGREEIEQRERHRQRRQRALVSTVTATLIILLTSLTIVALWQAGEAERQRREAVKQRDILQARQLAFQAQALLKEGIGDMQSRGVLLAVEAMKRYQCAEATEALQLAVQLRAPILFETEGVFLGGAKQIIAFKPDESHIAIAGDSIRILDTNTGKLVSFLDVSAHLVTIDPSGNFIAAATEKEIVIWSYEKEEIVTRLPHEYIEAFSFDSYGSRLATTEGGKSIRLWSIQDGNLIATLSRQSESSYCKSTSLSISPDDQRIALTIYDGELDDHKVFIWSINNERLVSVFEFDDRVNAVCYSPDGKTMAVGVHGTVRLLDAQSGKELTRLGEDESRDIVSINFDGSGRLVAAVGWDGPARVWNVENKTEVARLEHERGIIGFGRVERIDLSSSGKYVATTEDILRLWHLEKMDINDLDIQWSVTNRRLSEFGNIAPPSVGDNGTFTPDNGHFVLKWYGQNAYIINSNTEQTRSELWCPEPIRRGCLSGDGNLAAFTGDEGSVRVFNTSSGKEIDHLYKASGIELVTLADETSLIAFVGNDSSLHVLSTSSGKLVESLGQSCDVTWAKFSPSGNYLVTSRDGVSLDVHDTRTGKIIAQLTHDRAISTLMWTFDEKYLATASDNDGSARITHIEKNHDVLRWHLKTNLAWASIGFSKDERYFIFKGIEYDDTEIAKFGLWRPNDLIDAACKTVNRNLTLNEWERYFPSIEPYRETCQSFANR